MLSTKAILIRHRLITRWRNNTVVQCDAGEGRNTIFLLCLERIRIMGFCDLRPMEYFSVSRKGEY